MADQTTTDPGIVSDLEHLIKTHITNLDKLKKDLKSQREMLKSALENDETYRSHHEKVKEATRVRAGTKKQIMAQQANKLIADKILESTAGLRQLDAELSDYLREYQRLSGTNEIEGDDGEVREIVYVTKLVKKPQKVR